MYGVISHDLHMQSECPRVKAANVERPLDFATLAGLYHLRCFINLNTLFERVNPADCKRRDRR